MSANFAFLVVDYLKQYKSFVNSYYLSEGVRITIGVSLPAVVLGSLNNLSAGIMVSIGALCVSIPDNAGSIRHRRNAMLVCDALIFLVALCTGLASGFPVLLGAWIFICCFVFAMIGVYGARATSIGLAALLVMVLNIDRPQHGWTILDNALYVLAGGLWYTLLSLSIYGFRPYKLAQQALGECIQATADYLRKRALFYAPGIDQSESFDGLLELQSRIEENQRLVRELLFRSRNLIQESTNTGRVMVMIFLDIVDLFERIITAHQDYHVLHTYFEGSDILPRFQTIINALADELDQAGIAVKSGQPALPGRGLIDKIKALRRYFEIFRDNRRNASNVEAFIGLRQILDNVEDIGERIYALENYTTQDHTPRRNIDAAIEYEAFGTHQDIEPKLLWENLSVDSNTFRHAVRLCVATTTGYIVSKFLPFSHSYWILLTIIVIVKPAYSLTKKRNYHRLIGTILGIALGFALLFFVRDNRLIFALMIVLMIGAYSFMRTNYLVFVSLMTPYILLLFHLLNQGNFRAVVTDRLIDTVVGSAIAFIANIFLLPAWEHEQLRDYLKTMVAANLQYFLDTSAFLRCASLPAGQDAVSRKNAFVALVNLTNAFNRMLSEPKSKQKNVEALHQFVVASHMLTSHIATLKLFTARLAPDAAADIFSSVVPCIETTLRAALHRLGGDGIQPLREDRGAMRRMNDRLTELLDERKTELDRGIIQSATRKNLAAFKAFADQFNFIYKAAADTGKIAEVLGGATS